MKYLKLLPVVPLVLLMILGPGPSQGAVSPAGWSGTGPERGALAERLLRQHDRLHSMNRGEVERLPAPEGEPEDGGTGEETSIRIAPAGASASRDTRDYLYVYLDTDAAVRVRLERK